MDLLGFWRGGRGHDVAFVGLAGMLEDRALAVQQGVADRLGRQAGPLLQAQPPGQVLHAGEGRAGDGQMRADAARGPVEDRSHLQVMLGDADARAGGEDAAARARRAWASS